MGDVAAKGLVASGPRRVSGVTPHAPFLTDEPDALSNDAFGHGDYAEALHSIVTDASPPLVVGLFGPWGVGKSSIIGALQRKVRDSDTAFVYFDAWRYEDDSLRRQFLRDVGADLSKDGRLKKRYDVEGELRELEFDTQQIKESLSFKWRRLLRFLLIGSVFGIIVLIGCLLGAGHVLDGSIGKKLLLAFLTTVITGLAAAVAQTISVDAVTVTRKSLSDPDRFADKFASLLKALRSDRLVIAVDNLDRSSPEKAIEVLATIKTYLEPIISPEAMPRSSGRATAEKKIVFVVAVDDEALRRHMVAQERARSDRFDEVAASHYVEEYLAKFFGARLPIRSILDDDMRDYVARYMKPLAKARGLDEGTTKDLITVVNAGLRGNPRGVKQFHNDLEVRLRLLEEREAVRGAGPPGISPPISREVAVVAKLALIEREWPAAFARLQADPLVYDRWMIEARRDDSVVWTARPERAREAVELEPDEVGGPALRADRRRLATFLRASARIESKHLRAFLSLKQARIEIELPAYGEFRDALTADERKRVSEILEASAEAERGRLLGRVTTILGEELASVHLDAARSIVDIVCSSEAFSEDEEVRRQVIEKAADEPDLQAELPNLDPVAVLRAGELLDLPACQRLFEPFLGLYHRTDVGNEERAVVARALASYVDRFSDQQRTGLQTAIGGGLRDEPDLLLPFVEADDSLLAPVALDAALEALSTQRGEGPRPEAYGPLHRRLAAVEIARIGMGTPAGPGRTERLLDIVRSTFEGSAGVSEDLEADIADLRELARSAEGEHPDHFAAIARAIAESFPAVTATSRRDVIEFAGEALDRCAEEVANEVVTPIISALFEEPAAAFKVIDGLEPVPRSFRWSILERLGTFTVSVEFWADALRLAARIDSEGFASRLVFAVDQHLRGEQIEIVGQIFDLYEDRLEEAGETFTGALLAAQTDRIAQGNPGPPDLLARLAGMLDDGQRDELALHYADALLGVHAAATREVLEELPRKAESLRLLAAHYAVGKIDAEPGQTSPALLGLVSRSIGQLTTEDKEHYAEQLATRIRSYPDQARAVANALVETEDLPAAMGLVLAEALLEVEPTLIELEPRSDLLRAVWHLRVRRDSNVWKRLRERAAVLGNAQGETDQELGRRVREWMSGR